MIKSPMAHQMALLALSCLGCLPSGLVLQMWIRTSSQPDSPLGCPPPLAIIPRAAVGTELEVNVHLLPG